MNNYDQENVKRITTVH